MVLQQGKPIEVWGWDVPESTVVVSLGKSSSTGRTDKQGRWKAVLPALSASAEPQTLKIAGSTTAEFNNVLIGEVWLASGQSNMDFRLSVTTGGPDEARQANFPDLRIFRIEKEFSPQSKPDLASGEWKVCAPGTISSFSAVAYYFGKELRAHLKTPIGLIQSTVPGVPIETWMRPESLVEVYPPAEAEVRQKKWPPATQLYRGMIGPLVPYSLRGFIWYQGEGNGKDGARYTPKMKSLVSGWRTVWKDELPFYFVQIAPRRFTKPDEGGPTDLPELWEAQTQAAAEIPGSGMAVISDTTDLDIHPKNKTEVGKRLALLALNRTYGLGQLVCSGPTFDKLTVEGNKLRVHFVNCGSGLASRDGAALSWFEMRDRAAAEYVPAVARIEGKDTVVLTANGVGNPVAMRFAWDNAAQPNLMNQEGLPAGGFRAEIR